ncbi:MAG: hypothetical protein JW969_00545 [Spirochaetales bacterium]|nr:hypothetical protein [Spirochaetales bacterium]
MKKFYLAVSLVMILTFMLICLSCKDGWKVAAEYDVKKDIMPAKDQRNFGVTGINFLGKNFGIAMGGMGYYFYMHEKDAWKMSESSFGMSMFALEIVDEQYAFSSGKGKLVCRTDDGGITWNQVGSFLNGKYLSFIDRNNGWIASEKQLAKTEDGGVTFQELTLPENCKKIRAINLLDSRNGYLFDSDGKLYFTPDGGANWEERGMCVDPSVMVKRDTESPVTAMRFSDAETGMLITWVMEPEKKWMALATENGGKSWDVQKMDGPFGSIYITRDNNSVTIADSKVVTRYSR